jgi:hypothetical protein
VRAAANGKNAATLRERRGVRGGAGVGRSYWVALSPYHTSVYVNFLMDEGEERIRQAYGAEKYGRLKSLKRKYDKTNFFRLNQNISPDNN